MEVIPQLRKRKNIHTFLFKEKQLCRERISKKKKTVSLLIYLCTMTLLIDKTILEGSSSVPLLGNGQLLRCFFNFKLSILLILFNIMLGWIIIGKSFQVIFNRKKTWRGYMLLM